MDLHHHLILSHWLLAKFQQEIRDREGPNPKFGPYTPHGSAHCQGVDGTVGRILDHQHHPSQQQTNGEKFAEPEAVSDLERFLLRFCAWAHDVGMIESVASEYFAHLQSRGVSVDRNFVALRKHHDDASAFFVAKTVKGILKCWVSQLTTQIQRLGADRALEEQKTQFSEVVKCEYLPTDVEDIFRFVMDRDNRSQLESQVDNLVYTVNLVASFHRRANDITQCPDRRYLFGVPIRPRLLAAVFRLGDALHVDRSRVDGSAYEAIKTQPYFTMESRLHWIKSFLVTEIRIDAGAMRIDVQLDVPTAQPGLRKRQETEKRAQMISELSEFIQHDLEDELHSVTPVLVRHSFPTLLEVRCRVHEVPAMDHEEDIWGVLEYLRAAASPNTSQLIQAGLDSIRRIIRDIDTSERTGLAHDEQLDRLMSRLHDCERGIAEQLATRRCHEGLQKIRAMLAGAIALFDKSDNSARGELVSLSRQGQLLPLLMLFLDGIHRTFIEQRESCLSNIKNGFFDNVLDKYSGIVVYGYSAQALALIEQCAKLRSANDAKMRNEFQVFVLECRTKTLYTPTGQILYHDGKRYATEVRRRLDGTHPRSRVILMPDAQLGRILEDSGKLRRKLLVLLGSNAIAENGDVLHSMGHITVAATAKEQHFSLFTDVIVATDGLKIGARSDDLAKQYHTQRNEGHWLSHLASLREDLAFENVELNNRQEDAVPLRLIDQILVLDRQKEGVGLSIKIEKESIESGRCAAELAAAKFLPFKVFSDAFKIRFVAARIREFVDKVYKTIPEIRTAWKDEKIDDVTYRLAEDIVGGNAPECPTLTKASSHEWQALVEEAQKAVALDTDSLMELYHLSDSDVTRQAQVSGRTSIAQT